MTSTSNGTARTAAVTDQVTDLFSRGQQAMTEAATGMAELWTAAFQGADEATRRAGSGSIPGSVPSAADLVDRAYDTGIAVLEMQRSMAHQVLDALRLR